MDAKWIFLVFLFYSLMLFGVSFLTSRKANNDSFFRGNRVSPWWVVAYGMIGASLSGVTFVSIPGAVGADNFSYLVLVFGYFVGYMVIMQVLLPLYYRLNLTSIYTYFEQRFGFYTYKSGASYFLLSRIIGASFRMYLIISILQAFVFDAWGVPIWITTASFIILILLYTFKGGIKTIVWTDTLQTTFMLASVIITLYFIGQELNLRPGDLLQKILDSDYSQPFIMDWKHEKFYLKQFISGAFISLVMTGMDQDMMQKNLSCRNLKDAKKNIFWMSLSLIPINLIFLFLGAALFIYGNTIGLDFPEKSDQLYPLIAFEHLGPIAGVVFMVGLIAAAYSSADSALTSLTTSFSVDILNLNQKKYSEKQRVKIRKFVHLGVSLTLLIVILIFSGLNEKSIIDELFTVAGYTYGPILGLFSFGLLSRYQIKDKYVIAVVLASPIISYLLNLYSKSLFNGYEFGFELLLINGLITFMGLFIIRKQKNI